MKANCPICGRLIETDAVTEADKVEDCVFCTTKRLRDGEI